MTDDDDLNLTPEELAELQKFVGGATAPSPEEKHSIHKFLHEVSISDDTTKTGYLKEEEVGIPKNPLRTYKNLALISRDILDNEYFMNHFLAQGEILTSTSLSKDAKLLSLAVIQKRQLEDVTKKRKSNKGWFKKVQEEGDE